MHLILHSLSHSFLDTLKIIPFIFLMYLIIEYFEHKNNTFLSHFLMKAKKAGPIFGSLFGSVPQCGFSVIASDLYAKGAITLGTLIAIFISTSDEAVPILLSHPKKAHLVVNLILIKLIFGIVFGFLVDFIYKKKIKPSCDKHEHEQHHHFHGNCESCGEGLIKPALIHTVKIFVFIFIASFLITCLTEYIGEVALSSFVLHGSLIQPFLAAIVGLIPNCAPSVILTQSYISGLISFGSLIAGLSANAGIGILVLFKHNKNTKENLAVLAILYIISSISGLILEFIPFIY